MLVVIGSRALISWGKIFSSVHHADENSRNTRTGFPVAVLICAECSLLGKNSSVKATDMLSYAVAPNNVYVALDEHGKCLGFIYYMTKGAFGSYLYLHIIAVKEEYRSHGIGKQLMSFFEDNASDQPRAKYFLTVDDYNPRARKLYENLEY